MYASLRFPQAPGEETEYRLPPAFAEGILGRQNLTAEEKKLLLWGLGRSCADPAVLEYRSRFGAELLRSEALCRAMTELGAIGRMLPAALPSGEVESLRTVARFEAFATRFDGFFQSLADLVPESEGAKRCLRFLKRYGESYEYKELKHKCAELIQSFDFASGVLLALGQPRAEGTALLFRSPAEDGLSALVRRVREDFSSPLPEAEPPSREYTPMEEAVLTGILRGNPSLLRRMEKFFALYTACGTEDVIRLGKEAAFFVATRKLYGEGLEKGYSVCCPRFRAPGYYAELTGLCYDSEEGVGRANYTASPMAPVTVVCGPDAMSYLQAVETAHIFSSAGGLVFAEGAEISPCDRVERDGKEQIRIEGLNENSLCLCGNLFDVMLPRQEEAAAREVLARLCDSGARSVVRLCAQSNLSALQKLTDGGVLPPCTFLRAGTDRTLEDLLKRHNLTAEELEGSHHD